MKIRTAQATPHFEMSPLDKGNNKEKENKPEEDMKKL
jgi:hypothetical protein